MAAGVCRLTCQQFQGCQYRKLALLPLLDRPFLHAPLQKGAAVQRCCDLKRTGVAGRDCRVELFNVDIRSGCVKLQRVNGGSPEPDRLWTQSAAQVIEGGAEIAEGGLLGAVRPERSGKPRSVDLAP